MKEKINEIIDCLEGNLQDAFNIEDIARRFGYSKYHFSREFKKITGVSPSEYVMGLRINKGIDSLIDGETVINSQLEAGYNSSGTFSTTFKKKHRTSTQGVYGKN